MTTTYFADSFSGTTLNTANWNYGFPGEPNGPEGWEPQCYMDNSCVAVNNNLHLICEKGTHGRRRTLVEVWGVEPQTFSLRTRRSTN